MTVNVKELNKTRNLGCKTFAAFTLLCALLSIDLAYRYISVTGAYGALEQVEERSEEDLSVTKLSPLNLHAGELPTYSGWPRPSSTVAYHFRIQDACPTSLPSSSSVSWSCTIKCPSCATNNMSSTWFYIRAYGPAIVAGHAQKVGVNEYKLSLPPLIDAGSYVIEAIVTFSNVPPMKSFPMKDAPLYEGYTLHDFPKNLQVTEILNTTQEQLRPCSLKQLFREPDTSRWRITARNAYQSSFQQSSIYESYIKGDGGSGYHAAYERSDCDIPKIDVSKWKRGLKKLCEETHCQKAVAEIVLIGDSTMNQMFESIQTVFRDIPLIRILFVSVWGGVIRCFRTGNKTDISSVFDASISSSRRVVLWNSGLHEIHRLCGFEFARDRASYLTEKELKQPCTEVYQKALEMLHNATQIIPSAMTVFSLTQASWPKYGTHAMNWSGLRGQHLPLDPGFVFEFNKIATAFAMAHNVSILQNGAYAMTLSRPDHRELSKKGGMGKKMAHPGVDVVSQLTKVTLHWAWQVLKNDMKNA